jgi:hypothetical protein
VNGRGELNAIAEMFVAIFEGAFGDAGFVEITETFGDHPVVLFFRGARERQVETEIARELMPKSLATFITAQSAQVALREGILYVCVLQFVLQYELEQISKPEILRKLKQRFGGKTIRDIRFRIG